MSPPDLISRPLNEKIRVDLHRPADARVGWVARWSAVSTVLKTELAAGVVCGRSWSGRGDVDVRDLDGAPPAARTALDLAIRRLVADWREQLQAEQLASEQLAAACLRALAARSRMLAADAEIVREQAEIRRLLDLIPPDRRPSDL